MTFFYAYLLFINVVACITMYRDKQKARKNEWRVRESTLWTLATIGGAIGIWFGMRVYRHKTKHISFRIGTPLLIIIQLALVLFFLRKMS